MWVYQEPLEKTLSVPAQPGGAPPQPKPALPQGKGEAASTAARPATPASNRARRLDPLTRNCVMLAGAYLFGALLSGAALALCGADEAAALSLYLDSWCSLFVLDEPGSVWALFGAEYLAAAGAATVLLLLGLSALGAMPIYLAAMLYGLGMGTISLQLVLHASWQSAALCLLFAGLPTAAAASALCIFGASAIGVSSRLQKSAFSRRGGAVFAGARALLGQYMLLGILFLPLCGGSTALVCLVNQLSRYLPG